MYHYFLAIELPVKIKKQLATLCFGPQQIRWVEGHDLYFIVKSLGVVGEEAIQQIQQDLDALFFLPFSFILNELKHARSKETGMIGMSTSENPLLLKLKKELDRLLKKYQLKKSEEFMPVVLGYYDKLSFEKLNDYLTAHSEFQSEPILVDGIALVRANRASKRGIMEEVAFYPASSAATGED